MKKINTTDCQKIMLDIFKTIDRICRRNNIQYYMAAGTMLGAIRHRGFIPWDDDMDLVIPRNDYNRFIEIVGQHLPHHLRLLTNDNSDAINYRYAKIEYVDSMVVKKGHEHCQHANKNLGIHIDVFPLDGVSNRNVIRWLQMNYVIVFLKLYSACIFSPNMYCGLTRLISRLLHLFPFNKKKAIHHLDKTIERFSNKKSRYFVDFNGRCGIKIFMEKECYGQAKEYEFENHRFFGPENYHAYLTNLYGDYMKIPSKKKQVTHLDSIYLLDDHEK